SNVKMSHKSGALDIPNQQTKDTINASGSQLRLLEESNPQMADFINELGRLNNENGILKSVNKDLKDENSKLSLEYERAKIENARLKSLADKSILENDNLRKEMKLELERIQRGFRIELERKVEREVTKRVDTMLSSVQRRADINVIDNSWNNRICHTKNPSEPTKDSEWTGESEDQTMENEKMIDTGVGEDNRNNFRVNGYGCAINNLSTPLLLTRENDLGKRMDCGVTTARCKEAIETRADGSEKRMEAKASQDGCRYKIKVIQTKHA
ncbi:4142_t:CDS:1, partial [Acaulospora colombiana]